MRMSYSHSLNPWRIKSVKKNRIRVMAKRYRSISSLPFFTVFLLFFKVYNKMKKGGLKNELF